MKFKILSFEISAGKIVVYVKIISANNKQKMLDSINNIFPNLFI